jgi:nitrite reductase (NADH) small subunit/3-phenylpropionate/trans-cinnamate dioxygenase ferredoxin subunit
VAGAPRFVAVAAAADLPPGGSLAVRVDGVPIALFNVSGTVHAVENVCPHAGAALDRGARTGSGGEVVICPFHGWRFDVRTGRCVQIPGVSLRTFRVRVTDGAVEVEVGG